MNEKIGPLIMDLEGKYLSSEEKELLAHPLVGGVIFFARNYESREQLQGFCRQIREANQKPLLLMVDQEGGRVQRFTHEFTRLPFMAEFGRMYDQDRETALKLAYDCGLLLAAELLSAGVDLSLAPVLDMNKGLNTVIGARAFHSQSRSIIDLALAFINGMKKAGMSATGKHFPGHGSVTLDSHVAIPIDERPFEEIANDDMSVFTSMIKSGLPAVMAAHIIFPQVDTCAVSFSRYWLQDILCKRLGFKGVIFSDDLNMKGADISSRYADRVMAAREAGCDFALLCNNRKGVVEVLNEIPFSSHFVDKNKWGTLQGKFKKTTELTQTHLEEIRKTINHMSMEITSCNRVN